MTVATLTKVLTPCQRCISGTVLLGWNGLSCCNCGAEHNPDGTIIEHPVGSKNFEGEQQGGHYKRKDAYR